jgi:gamma-glutamylcyclotransferase (GGCT)/AIG2-like uncharacterized protein YtfP
MRFFFYGTLLDPEVRRHVIGPTADAHPAEPAVLAGYRCVYMSRKTYPVAVPDRKGSVQGCLVRGLDKAARARLVAFETNEYDEAEREVRTAAGMVLRCRVFVASRLAAPSSKVWDFASWQKRHADDFKRRMRRGEF